MGHYFKDHAAPTEVRGDDTSTSTQTGNVYQDKLNARKNVQSQYFAAAKPEFIGSALMDKVDDWINYCNSTPHFARIQKAYSMYYGWNSYLGPSSSGITQVGPQGQYSLAYINEFRNTTKHVLNMITQQKITGECHGANTDVETTESCELGNALIEQVIREKDVGLYLKRGAEYGCFLSEGHIGLDWDHWGGSPYTVDEIGQPVWEGDISLDYFPPWNVIKDHWRRDEKMPWVMLVRFKNRFDLVMRYPEKQDQILACDPSDIWKFQQNFFNQYLVTDGDLIPEITFYHARTPALPNGRLVRFLNNSTVLFDGDLPYKNVPVYRIAPDHLAETPHGYTFAFDLMSVQDLQNLVDSITTTIYRTFGLGIVKLPEGHNMKYQQLAQGLMAMVINENNGKAEAMNFAQIPGGIFDWRAWLSSRQDIIAGINSVIKGQPDKNIQAGNFAALIAAQAYQFSTQLEESYQTCCQGVLQGIIEMYQTFANTKRVVKMVGKNKEYMLRSFRKEDLQAVSTVTVDIGNPATSTTAMRMQIADTLLNTGKIDTADKFLKVMETGKLEHVTEPKETEQNNIDRENEMLRKASNPKVLITDDPIRHVQHHLTLLDDPLVRDGDQSVVAAILGHITQHLTDWQSLTVKNPAILAIKNIPPAPAQPQMMAPAPSGGGSMPPAPGPNPSLPNLPKNPMTGEPPPVNPPNVAPPPTASAPRN